MNNINQILLIKDGIAIACYVLSAIILAWFLGGKIYETLRRRRRRFDRIEESLEDMQRQLWELQARKHAHPKTKKR